MAAQSKIAHRAKISLENGYSVILAFQDATGVAILAPETTIHAVQIEYRDPRGECLDKRGFHDLQDFFLGTIEVDVPLD